MEISPEMKSGAEKPYLYARFYVHSTQRRISHLRV